jgi:KilA-N domain
MIKNKTITVQGQEITIISHKDDDYISLTDLCKGFDGEGALIEKWLTTKNTLEYLTVWETLNNPNFNSPEIGGILNNAGSNNFYMSVKKWVSSTGAIGIMAKTGRTGGTYAHKDVALKFGSYLSPAFELYINIEFKRLKEAEENSYNLEWNVKRIISKANYHIQTDAIQKHIIPKSALPESKRNIEYAIEADLLTY